MTTQSLLQAGIAAVNAGEIAQASKLLLQVVQADPNSELGWFWLGLCRTPPAQREFCFQRVLAINPKHAEAKRQLDLLHGGTTPLRASTSSPASDTGTRAQTPSFTEPPQDLLPINEKANQPVRVEKSFRSSSQKKNNNWLIWAGMGLGVFACLALAGIFILGKMMNAGTRPSVENQIPSVVPTVVTAMPATSYQPTFQGTDCRFQTPEKSQVSCGYVIVPEDRSGDLTDTIRIAVAVFHSTNTSPKPDPILYLQGGPGDKAITWSVGAFPSVIAPLLGERDFIVFDPRGVGYSEPALNCDEFGKTYLQDLQGKIPAAQAVSYYQGALLSCKNNLRKLGANLSTYTSSAMAADAKDVLLALGYQQANLYGVSYGTRVAQFMMRDHPEMVRSAILDSVVPVETQLLNQSTAEQDYALHVLFNDCKSDSACSSAYPDLESTYNEVFNRLNAKPINLTVNLDENRRLERQVDGWTFRNTIMWTLRMPQTIGLAPQLIYRSRDGDNSTLLLSLAFPVLAFDSISMGSYISVNCHDQVFAVSMEKLDKVIFDMCKLWDAKPPLPGENDPVNSQIPTLIFAGKYDSTTPPSFADQLAKHLTHSYVAEIRNQGHAPSTTGLSDCPTKLISTFLADPTIPPDLTCVKETTSVKFIVPDNTNNPLVLKSVTIDQYHVNTRIPDGWSDGGYNFYNRNGYFGDMTQIGIQSTAIPESNWLTWLATNFGTNRGFDQPAVKHAERQANGLTWSIYETSSQGYPVDLAFAKSKNQTLMVLLISHKDEHDALYNKVFLPVVDATTSSQ